MLSLTSLFFYLFLNVLKTFLLMKHPPEPRVNTLLCSTLGLLIFTFYFSTLVQHTQGMEISIGAQMENFSFYFSHIFVSEKIRF
jgi:hypothetical protein